MILRYIICHYVRSTLIVTSVQEMLNLFTSKYYMYWKKIKMQTKSPKDDELEFLFKFIGWFINCWRVKVVLAFIKSIVPHNSQSKVQCRMLNGEANFDF